MTTTHHSMAKINRNYWVWCTTNPSRVKAGRGFKCGNIPLQSIFRPIRPDNLIYPWWKIKNIRFQDNVEYSPEPGDQEPVWTRDCWTSSGVQCWGDTRRRGETENLNHVTSLTTLPTISGRKEVWKNEEQNVRKGSESFCISAGNKKWRMKNWWREKNNFLELEMARIVVNKQLSRR